METVNGFLLVLAGIATVLIGCFVIYLIKCFIKGFVKGYKDARSQIVPEVDRQGKENLKYLFTRFLPNN